MSDGALFVVHIHGPRWGPEELAARLGERSFFVLDHSVLSSTEALLQLIEHPEEFMLLQFDHDQATPKLSKG